MKCFNFLITLAFNIKIIINRNIMESVILVFFFCSSALYATWWEEKHRNSPGGLPSYSHSEDLQIPSAAEGIVQLLQL